MSITTGSEARPRFAAIRAILEDESLAPRQRIAKGVRACVNAVNDCVDAPVPPIVEPPPAVVPPPVTIAQPVRISDGKSHTFAYVEIRNDSLSVNEGMGIQCVSGDVIRFDHATIHSMNYAAWLECNEVIGNDSFFITHGAGNDYPHRAYPKVKWRTTNCTFDNRDGKLKASSRIVGCTDHISDGDHYFGGRVMCGGGGVDEWKDEQPAVRVYRNGTMAVESVEVYDKSHTTLENMDLAGTGHIFVDDGGTLIVKGCRNAPEIKRKSLAGTTVTITN